MNLKFLSLVVGSLFLLSLVTFLLQSRRQVPSLHPLVGQNILPEVVLANVGSIELEGGGSVVRLAFDPTQETWVVRSHHDLPLDFSKLSELVRSLQEARVRRFVTANPERMEALDLGDRQIRFFGPSGDLIWRLEIGRTASSGGSFIRPEPSDPAFVADQSLWVDISQEAWARKLLTDFQARDVRKLEVVLPDGPQLSFSRESAESPWLNASKEVTGTPRVNQIATLLNRFTNLRYTRSDSLDSQDWARARTSSHLVHVTLEDGSTHRIEIFREPPPTLPEDAEDTAPAPVRGPAFVRVTSNPDALALDDMMQRRAFVLANFIQEQLPKTVDNLLDPPAAEEEPLETEP